MKRTAMVCLLVMVLAATLTAPVDAAKGNAGKVTRRAVATYGNPTLGSASGTGGATCLPCPSFGVARTEAWVEVEVYDDASPAPGAFGIRQARRDGTCCIDVAGPFCGSTGTHPVRITRGNKVYVFVYASGDVACPGAFGTSGSVKAVFSNVP